MAKTRCARMDAENGHRRVTRSRLRIIVKETRGYPTGYLRAQPGTIEYDRGSREFGCDEATVQETTCDFLPEQPEQPDKLG